MKTLVLVEHDNAEVAAATLSTVKAASSLGQDIDLLVATNSQDVVQKASKIEGVSKVDQGAYEVAVVQSLNGTGLLIYSWTSLVASAETTRGPLRRAPETSPTADNQASCWKAPAACQDLQAACA